MVYTTHASPQPPLHVAPHLMVLTVQQLSRENAELFEEVRQLRAAVNVYRELATSNGPGRKRGLSVGKVRAGRGKLQQSCRFCVL
jgi:hypothetical protein